MIHPPQFDESDVITLIDRLIRVVPGLNGGSATVRQITQRQERYRGGYDAVVSTVLPIYVQAKTSSFHPDHSRSDIISDRSNLKINSSPGAFAFYLRKHKGTDEPLQHNALFWMSLRSTATYVCPTYVSEKRLDMHLHDALAVKRKDVWGFKDTNYHDLNDGTISNLRARHFSGLVSIVPHRLVDNYLHRYSYTANTDSAVVFHSDPEKVPTSKSFGEFISDIVQIQQSPERSDDLQNPNLFKSVQATQASQLQWIEESFEQGELGLRTSLADIALALNVAKLSNSADFRYFNQAMRHLQKLDWIDLAAFWGSMLSEKYSIRQFMVMEFID